MPSLTLPLNTKVIFTHHKGERQTNYSPREIDWLEVKKIFPVFTEEDIEEFLWEARDEWKED